MKFSLFIFIVIFTIIICQLLLNSMGIQKYFSMVEKNDIETHVTYAKKIWDNEIDGISQTAIDYSRWDDVYFRMEARDYDEAFFRENFMEWLPESFEIDVIVLLDTSGSAVVSNMAGTELEKRLKDAATEDGIKGYFRYGDKIYIVAQKPITRSDGTGQAVGSLLLGREIDANFVAALNSKFGYDIFFAGLDGEVLQASKDTYEMLGKRMELEEAQKITSDFIAGTTEIHDISGNSIALLGVAEPRDFMSNIYRLMKLNTVIAIVMSGAVIYIWGLIFKREIIKPMSRLEKEISKIKHEEDLQSIMVEGPQEIRSLAEAFNTMVESIRTNKEENIRLRTRMNMDELTGLYNRKYLHEKFSEMAMKSQNKISIILCDIDRFREVNNTYGYSGGDIFLKEIGMILRDTVGNQGFVFRYSGEQFAVMLEGVDKNEALPLAENIRKNAVNVSEKLQIHFRRTPFTMSVGITTHPTDSSNLEVLLQKANLAVHSSKQSGGNICSIYGREMEQAASAGMEEYFEMKGLLDSVLAFARAIDTKDSYTGEHSDLVAKYSLLIADKLDISEKDKIKLRIGALLHDSGKLGIPDSIINKTSRLTEEEYEIIKRHPLLGEDIIKGITRDENVVTCVRSHHERWDGKGYPDGISGEDIPLYARIVSIADAFHAMTSQRPYRDALTLGQALEEIEKSKGTQFDPYLAELFIDQVSRMQNSEA